MSKKIKPLNLFYSPSQLEGDVLNYWQKEDIFKQSVDQRQGNDEYVFYDGPPFATGLPHYGHLLGSIIKDVVPRFQTMKGKHVERVWGWDCHGLPAENKVEEQLGLKSKKDIEEIGVGKFTQACANYVSQVSDEWKWYINRIGRWVDFENAYRTMDQDYMESVLWVFKQLYDKDLIYKGNRVSLFCPRCSTPISNFEVAMDNSYKDVTDTAIFVKFKASDSNDHFLAWTTTPWTLPANAALAVNPDEDYSRVKFDQDIYVLATKRIKDVFKDKQTQVVETFKGEQLLGKSFVPLYSYHDSKPADFQVYSADFVTMEEGTGIVHVAPGFGEDDTTLGKEKDLSMFETIDDTGTLKPEIEVAASVYFKKANKMIIADLEERNLLLYKHPHTHSYPHCHRCQTPLIYKAQESWYIDIQKLKKQLLKTNEDINWVPEYFKHGRFHQGIENAPDWCISRTRYWGSPFPVWECSECDYRFVPESIKDLEKESGQKVTDLHRPAIDDITVTCPKCKKEVKRVPDVLDCWVESASMPYAQLHYPFENKDKFKKGFPADFITEYTGQLRAWFYVTHVVSNALFNTHSFNNVIVSGVILGTDGRKMSKLYNNYPDPKEGLNKLGADSLRLYLMGSPLVNAQDVSISELEWQEQIKTILMILFNSYKFFVNYASIDGWEVKNNLPDNLTDLDTWILSRLKQTITKIENELSQYRIHKAVAQIRPFVSDLSTWFIRRSRDRVGPSAVDAQDRDLAYTVMYTIFDTFFRAIAPITPFISESLYRHLTGEKSVHLSDWPKTDHLPQDDKLLGQMSLVRKICELGNAQRKEKEIPVKQPLTNIKVYGQDFLDLDKNKSLIQLIKEELNLEKVQFIKDKELKIELDTQITPRLEQKRQTREIIRSIQQARKQADCRLDQKIEVVLPDYPQEFAEEIKQKTLATNLTKGDQLEIKKLS